MKNEYIFHSDAGHGWLAVPYSELVELGIINDVSYYSYQNGKTVYLEEDMDADTYMKARDAKGWPKAVIKQGKVYERNSPIRSYNRYRSHWVPRDYSN